MKIDLTELNFVSILIAIIFNQGFGALWYSPVLFGNSWADLVGIKQDEIDKKSATRAFILALIFAVVVYFIISFVIMLASIDSWLWGALTGLLISLIVALQLATNYAYEDRSIKLYLINAFYPIICYTAGGAVIGAF
jgi:polyferredoxin